MRLAIGFFVLAILAAVTAGFSMAYWDGRIGHHGMATRTIHYGTSDELSARRRIPAE